MRADTARRLKQASARHPVEIRRASGQFPLVVRPACGRRPSAVGRFAAGAHPPSAGLQPASALASVCLPLGVRLALVELVADVRPGFIRRAAQTAGTRERTTHPGATPGSTVSAGRPSDTKVLRTNARQYLVPMPPSNQTRVRPTMARMVMETKSAMLPLSFAFFMPSSRN